MSISSNSLFHFTDNIDTVKKILSDKFYGSYCKETLHYKLEKVPLIIPMISFCDIPLKTISMHSKYGKFGIGLTKDWGIRSQLNPVFYLEKSSSLADSLIKSLYGSLNIIAFTEPELTRIKNRIDAINKNRNYNQILKKQELQKLQGELTRHNNMADSMRHLIYSLYYTKHYSDELDRTGVVIPNYKFYDEREWRYLPEFECAVCELRRTEADYIQWRGTSKQKPILAEVNLSFAPGEIDYLIVELKDQKKEIREFIKQFDTNKFTQDQKEELYSKIISFEEVNDM